MSPDDPNKFYDIKPPEGEKTEPIIGEDAGIGLPDGNDEQQPSLNDNTRHYGSDQLKQLGKDKAKSALSDTGKKAGKEAAGNVAKKAGEDVAKTAAKQGAKQGSRVAAEAALGAETAGVGLAVAAADLAWQKRKLIIKMFVLLMIIFFGALILVLTGLNIRFTPDDANACDPAATSDTVPCYYQNGPANISPWANTCWPTTDRSGSCRTMAGSACGLTSMAMAISFWTGQKITPDVLAKKIGKETGRSDQCHTNGLDYSCIPDIPTYYGLPKAKKLSSWSEAKDYLSRGIPVLTTFPPNVHWTRNGHFVLFTGMSGTDKVFVNDPNYYSFSGAQPACHHAVPVSWVNGIASNYWAISGTASHGLSGGTAPDSSSGKKVYILGDSLSVGLSNVDTKKILQNGGWDLLKINALSGDSILGGLERAKSDSTTIKKAGAIVVELGTNNCNASTTSFKNDLKKLYTYLSTTNPSAKIYWVNYAWHKVSSSNSCGGCSSDDNAKNEALGDFASSKNITIIDWASVGNNYNTGDCMKIHPTSDGYKKMANLILSGLKSGNTPETACDVTDPDVPTDCSKFYKPQYTNAQLIKYFGGSNNGTTTKSKVDSQLTQIELFPSSNFGKATVNKKVAPCLKAASDEIESLIKAGKIHQRFEYSGSKTWTTVTGQALPSVITGSNVSANISYHSFAIAIDLNASTMTIASGRPCGSGDKTFSDLIVKTFKKYGFAYGGTWHSFCDAVHFEWHGIVP